MIRLSRYGIIGEKESAKIQDPLKINQQLRIKVAEKFMQYNLLATLNHAGTSMNVGHYTTIKYLHGTLFKCDDNHHCQIENFDDKEAVCYLYINTDSESARKKMNQQLKEEKNNHNEKELKTNSTIENFNFINKNDLNIKKFVSNQKKVEMSNSSNNQQLPTHNNKHFCNTKKNNKNHPNIKKFVSNQKKVEMSNSSINQQLPTHNNKHFCYAKKNNENKQKLKAKSIIQQSNFINKTDQKMTTEKSLSDKKKFGINSKKFTMANSQNNQQLKINNSKHVCNTKNGNKQKPKDKSITQEFKNHHNMIQQKSVLDKKKNGDYQKLQQNTYAKFSADKEKSQHIIKNQKLSKKRKATSADSKAQPPKKKQKKKW